MAENEDEQLRCDVLIIVTTSSEREQLKDAARAAGLRFQRQSHSRYGTYYSLGTVGDNRVRAVRTEMGPFGHEGSASKALQFKAVTGATGLIQLGMAFGVSPGVDGQRKGDVLVSTSLIPYDNRKVVPADAPPLKVFAQGEDAEAEAAAGAALGSVELASDVNSPSADRDVPPAPETGATGEPVRAVGLAYRVDYSRATRYRSKASLLNALLAERDQGEYDHGIYFGGMLSGGALICSSAFLRELIQGVPSAEDGIIGGDMEGVGLLSSSPQDNPAWIVVKGISDFADEARHLKIDEVARTAACQNSARFVLNALLRTKIT